MLPMRKRSDNPAPAVTGDVAKAGPTSTAPGVASAAAARGDETIRDTFESIVIAFILAFVFRAYVVEAFVIPTGSMAPTLLGAHVRVVCEECGYDFVSEWPDRHTRGVGENRIAMPLDRRIEAICPMCHFPNALPAGARVNNGDRILVHKFIYDLTEPKRWDVVVFKNPSLPQQNFIKRLTGLPNERVWIIDGNIHVQPLNQPDAAWRIARKTDRTRVQRTVWQPIYHSQHVPLDGGEAAMPRRDAEGLDHPWSVPWRPDEAANWRLAEAGEHKYERYRYVHQSAERGAITFRFDTAARGMMSSSYGSMAWYPYNQFRTLPDREPIEDVRVAATFVPESAGLSLRIESTSRLDSIDPRATDRIIAGTIAPDGKAAIVVIDETAHVTTLATGQVAPFQPGRARQVEFWHVDQHASIWVDGKRVCHWEYEVPIDTLVNRPPPQLTPRIRITVEGSPVALSQVEVDRDIFYSSLSDRSGIPNGGWGTLVKSSDRREGEPITLVDERYFCLGDNSPMSSDGRYWRTVDPWIREQYLRDDLQAEGVVPRELMIGKAFFVYFPAPYAYRPHLWGIFPNFADMRFIH